jgi:enamine deaminase RidA (YjgF/YER057c/UK114 family)
MRASSSNQHPVEYFDVYGRGSNAVKIHPQASLVKFVVVAECDNLAECDVQTQTLDCIRQVDDILKQTGCEAWSTTSVQIYLKDIERDYAGMNSVYDAWVQAKCRGQPPVRACVEAKLYTKEALVEFVVEAVALDG